MQTLTFALKFHRPTTSNKDDPPTQATAQGVLISTLKIEPEGVVATIQSDGDQIAVLNNGFVLSGKDHQGPLFFEWGTITFGGDENTLTFTSIGTGTTLGEPVDGFTNGTVMWKIDSGTGLFKGATGSITDNFLVNIETNELIDYHFYMVYLP